MFQTDDSWECQSEVAVLRAIFGKPGLRNYPLVEVSKNISLFHVDVLFQGEGVVLDLWERFICCDLRTVVELIEHEDVVRTIVSMQSSFSRNVPYEMSEVMEIKLRSKGESNCAYSCLCKNGRYFSDCIDVGVDEIGVNVRTVLPRP